MGIYAPLENFLNKAAFQEIPMTFSEVSKVLGRPLPQSAYRHRPWWANEATGHSHARAWLSAGFETAQVDMAGQKLVFRRLAQSVPPVPPKSAPAMGLADWSRSFRPKEPPVAALFGALKGTFTIESGWDLTKPALEEELDIDRTADLIDSGLRK